MYSIDDLQKKIHEIEHLIRENTNPDGSANFDAYRVFIGLELARRMVANEENSDIPVDGQMET